MSVSSTPHHPHDPDAHASCAALRTLAHAIAAGLKPTNGRRHIGKAVDRKAGWQCVVILSPYQPPPPAPANGAPTETSDDVHSPTLARAKSPTGPPLREVEALALQAAPPFAGKPITVRALARRAGYADSGHWRAAINVLLERGLLLRIRGGVRRTEHAAGWVNVEAKLA